MNLPVTIKAVYWPRATDDATGFYVLNTDKGKASGKMQWRPAENERVTLTGEWGVYKGEANFNFTSATPDVPDNPRETLRYIVTRAHGIGPKLEEAIWNQCGEHYTDAQTLLTVKGLTPVKFSAFREACDTVKRESAKSKAIAWLMSKGATVNMAIAAFDKFGPDTVGVVNADPYRLAELPNYSFVDVDTRIRAAFGIADDDSRRVAAAVVYKLRQMTSGGATVIKYDGLRAGVKELIGAMNAGLIAATVRGLFEAGELVSFGESRSLALRGDFENEKMIYEFATMQD